MLVSVDAMKRKDYSEQVKNQTYTMNCWLLEVVDEEYSKLKNASREALLQNFIHIFELYVQSLWKQGKTLRHQ